MRLRSKRQKRILIERGNSLPEGLDDRKFEHVLKRVWIVGMEFLNHFPVRRFEHQHIAADVPNVHVSRGIDPVFDQTSTEFNHW